MTTDQDNVTKKVMEDREQPVTDAVIANFRHFA